MNDTRATAPADPDAFAALVERITNEVLVDAWLALYREDAVVESIIDGARELHEGAAEIRRMVIANARIWRERGLRVRKRVECADASTIVLSWRGGFDGDERQFGTEIWGFQDGRVARQQTYGYLDVRPATSTLARLRILLFAPRTAVVALKHARRSHA
ncbi:hypothetical protein PAI11_00500 [Patulibacter medicamentivorans]|uniref:SnoaL-like domain-containing protein n=2 Tax=Patulibacter medicamentivorans TaxID=1097667 RepID=H0DZU5_9ACTN|nr:hypothetical protein PAI11_00500 [Patulibacter medicamentivorans]